MADDPSISEYVITDPYAMPKPIQDGSDEDAKLAAAFADLLATRQRAAEQQTRMLGDAVRSQPREKQPLPGVRRIVVELEPDADEALAPRIWQALLEHFTGFSFQSEVASPPMPATFSVPSLRQIAALLAPERTPGAIAEITRRLNTVFPGVPVLIGDAVVPVGVEDAP